MTVNTGTLPADCNEKGETDTQFRRAAKTKNNYEYVAFNLGAVKGCDTHGSGDLSPVGPIPGQFVWDLWCAKQYCKRFLSRYFCFPLSVSFHQFSILIHPSRVGFVVYKAVLQKVSLPVLLFPPVSIFPPVLHTHSSISCGICGVQSSIAKGFSPGNSVSPCQYLSTNSPYSFTHLSLTIYNLSNGVSFNKTFHSVTDTSNLGLSVDKISVSIYCVLFYDAVTSSGYKKSNGMFSE